MKKELIALALAAAACGPLAAETIYRCGDAYSQKPCAGASLVQAEPDRASARDAQARRDATVREAKLADAMEKARLKEEAKPAQAYIPPPRPAATEQKKQIAMVKPEKAHYFTAISPGEPGATPKKKSKKKAA